LIIWAHFLLGLSVCVENGITHEQVVFLSQAPSVQVVIEISGKPLDGLEVCLLDREKKVVLRMDPSAAEFVPTRARERLQLRGYCSTTLCRYFDGPPTWKSLQAFKRYQNFHHCCGNITVKEANCHRRAEPILAHSSLITLH
jgi:hypothetical protein